MSNNLPNESNQELQTPPTTSSLPPIPPSPPAATPSGLPPLPDPSIVGTVQPSVSPLPVKDEVRTIHMSVPEAEAAPRKDNSVWVTLLIFFMLLVSGLGVYLYVAYTNLGNQSKPLENNSMSFSRP